MRSLDDRLLTAEELTQAELTRLRRLAVRLAHVAWDGGGLDGGEIQQMLVEAGALVPIRVTEPCGEHCDCAGWGDFPQTCYRLTDSLKGVTYRASEDDT